MTATGVAGIKLTDFDRCTLWLVAPAGRAGIDLSLDVR